MKTRFAPSPTGAMHFGNLRIALFNYLVARHNNGDFLLRIEDTDQQRSTQTHADALIADLQWMGIQWQEGPVYQSERAEIYDGYYQTLQDQDRAYPCFCSEETLARTRKLQLKTGQPPRYPGTCRHLTPKERAQKLQAGQKAALRFVVPKEARIEFQDLIKGSQQFLGENIGDFIIQRQSGSASFMFANAVDDALMQVTHVLRGDDHLTNSPRQILILQALGLPIPAYAHFPTILGLDGLRLSKRNGSVAVSELKAQGYQPLAISNYLARLGHYYANHDFQDQAGLAQEFDFSHVNTAPAKYDLAQLQHWQKLCVHNGAINDFINMIEPEIKTIVPQSDIMAFAKIIQPNITFPEQARHWAKVCYTTWDYAQESLQCLKKVDPSFFETGISALEQNAELSFSELLDQLKSKGFTGKRLFQPLRVLMSNRTDGPTLPELFELLGSKKVLNQFKKAQSLC